MAPIKKIIFMGTPQFSVPVLDALVADGYEICAVYSQPPRPAGRGHQIQKSPVHLRAEALGIPVLTPLNFKNPSDVETFANFKADLSVVVAYGLLLPEGILKAPQLGCINVHASLLPRWRGAAPIVRSLEAGDAKTGITIMQMDKGLDTGPMLSMAEIEIDSTMTGGMLHDQLSFMGADLLVSTLKALPQAVVQPQEGITYAHKLSKEEALVDWYLNATDLERRVRAFNPWPLMHFTLNGQGIKILEAQVLDFKGKPGDILDREFTVACGIGALRLLRIQPAGKKPMGGADYLRGLHGEILRVDGIPHA